MSTPLSYYKENSSRYTEAIDSIKQRITLIAVLRLVSFLLFIFAGYELIKSYSPLLMFGTIASLLIFFLLVRIALALRDKKALLEKLLFINNNEIAILQNEPSQFSDAKQFLTNDDYSADLDVFGPRSLFHLLNRTATYHGTRKLATMLQKPLLSKSAIEEHQQAVQALSHQKELRQLLTAYGLLHEEKEGNMYDVMSWLQLPPELYGKKWVQFVRIIIPAINIASIVYYFTNDNYFPLLLGVLISWVIIGIYSMHIKRQHSLISKKESILDQYASILKQFSQVNTGTSILLKQDQGLAIAAHQAIKKLSSLSSFFDQRLNMLVPLFLNSFFMYDIQCLWALESWKHTNKNKFNDWIHCVGDIESLNSLATFAFNNPAFQYPAVVTDKLSIHAVQLAHPLIPAKERVANDFSVGSEEQLILVTGSNMSGKTTFLRTLGINMLLAQCGAPVCATSFSFMPLIIRSSIRVDDSLQEHTSYFMAELKRLQQIIRYLQKNETPALILIDEILKGTNSEDKTHGSEQFIKKLLNYRCLTLFATHDLALSRLESELPGKLSNYCFESIIRDGELLFDYTLQRGVAKNKNASFLMQKMEII